MHGRLRRRAGATLTALGVLVALLVLHPAPASAAAYGCTYYPSGNYAGQQLTGGTYCVGLQGVGPQVDGVRGTFTATGNVCNYDVTADFYNDRWEWQSTRVSTHNYGCHRWDQRWIGIGSPIGALVGTPTGHVCSTLRVAHWKRVASVCSAVR